MPNEGRLVTVPPGHYFVEGDEQYHSVDSNSYGPVSGGLIEARVTRVVYPLERWGSVPPRDIRNDALVSTQPYVWHSSDYPQW